MRRRRLKLSVRDQQYLLAFVLISTVVASGIAYTILYPPLSERFFAMWVLGSKSLAEHYYPGDDPNIRMGDGVNWTLGVYNHMGSPQYVVVRVKLLNSSLPVPDELSGEPSPVSPLFEFRRVLLDNETWSVAFSWSILNVSLTGQSVRITALSINQFHLNGDLATANSGFNYRFIFELWSYDRAANDLVFSQPGAGSPRAVWTQIWFNVTASAPR